MQLGPPPTLTESFVARGFVVEREHRQFRNGFSDIRLHLTPGWGDAILTAGWCWAGPTAPTDDIVIEWTDPAARDSVIEAAEHPVEYLNAVDRPDERVTVAAGDGWWAIAPEPVTYTNLVTKRSVADRYGYEILGPVDPSIRGAVEYDLVEVDAEPCVYGEVSGGGRR